MAEGAGVAGVAGGMASLLDALAPTVVALHGMADVIHGTSDLIKGLGKVADNFRTALDGLAAHGLPQIKSAFDDLFKVTGLATTSIADSIPYFGAIIAVAGSVASAFIALLPAVLQVGSGLFQLGLAALPGGLKVFGDAIDYLTSVIGQYLTPIVTTVIAGLITLADQLTGPMHAATADFIESSMGTAIKWMAIFVEGVQTVIKTLPFLVEWVSSLAAWVGGGITSAVGMFVSAMNKIVDIVNAIVSTSITMLNIVRSLLRKEHVEGLTIPHAGDVGGAFGSAPKMSAKIGQLLSGIGGNKKSTEEQIQGNLASTINALQTELGKKGQVGFSGIADVQKQVQMQAIQNDIQGRTLQVQIDTLNILRERLGRGGNQMQATKK